MPKIVKVVRPLTPEEVELSATGAVVPGQLLGDVRQRAHDGLLRIYVTPSQRSRFRQLHSRSKREDHAKLSETEFYDVPIGHLANLPDETLVRVAIETHYDDEEQSLLPRDVT